MLSGSEEGSVILWDINTLKIIAIFNIDP